MLIIMAFCVKRKKITKGMVITRAPAAKLVNSFFLSVTKAKSPNAKVCLPGERSTSLGKIKSIHGPVKLEMPRKVMIGLVIGRIIVAKMRMWLAPSMRAASSKLLLTVSM